MIPLHTTTIDVLRSDQDGTKDRLDPLTWSTVHPNVRAVISTPIGSERVAGGSSEDVSARLDCDPVAIRHTDRVRDNTTGETFEVTWARTRYGLGLDHTVADLRKITDRAAV